MAEKTYAEKLQDPRWQRKRLEVMQRDDFKCQHCGDSASSLHIHHLAYNNKEPWEIENRLLKTLCKPCHDKESVNIKLSIADLINTVKNAGYDSKRISEICAEIQAKCESEKEKMLKAETITPKSTVSISAYLKGKKGNG